MNLVTPKAGAKRELLSNKPATEVGVLKILAEIISISIMNLVTPKAGAERELLSNKQASASECHYTECQHAYYSYAESKMILKKCLNILFRHYLLLSTYYHKYSHFAALTYFHLTHFFLFQTSFTPLLEMPLSKFMFEIKSWHSYTFWVPIMQ